jgi:hypothetical protein
MGRLIVLLALVAAVWWFLFWFRSTPAHQVAAVLRKAFIWGAVALVILAVVSGRLNPIFAAVAAAVPVLFRALNLLRMLPALQRLLQSLGLVAPGTAAGGGAGGGPGAGSAGGQSSIRTRYLDMTLEHANGTLDGRVREGPFSGQRLSALALPQLLRMLELYQEADARSAAVLTAYLDREHGDDWRDAVAAGAGGSSSGQAPARGGMSKEDAWSILGLTPGATAEDVRAAHRRLMQRLHPDRGGSDYLAAQINAAKDLLLGE